MLITLNINSHKIQMIHSSFPQCYKRTTTTHLPSRGHLSPPSPPSSISGTSVSATSVSGASVSAFLRLGDIRLGHIRLGDIRLGHIRLGDIRLMGIRLGLPPSRVHPSRGHPSRRHPSRGRPSSRLRRPRRMAQTDIPQMERHEDGGPIPHSFPSREHPPLPFVSAIRLLQFNSSKYTLASVRVQFICLRLNTRYCKKENKRENKEKTIRIHNNFINRRHTIQ